MTRMLPTQKYVSELVEEFMDGSLAIPEIQEDVVWEARPSQRTHRVGVSVVSLWLVDLLGTARERRKPGPGDGQTRAAQAVQRATP